MLIKMKHCIFVAFWLLFLSFARSLKPLNLFSPTLNCRLYSRYNHCLYSCFSGRLFRFCAMSEKSNDITSTSPDTVNAQKTALAPNHNLSGVWQAIKERSDDLDEFLKVMGLNWATRKLILSLNRKSSLCATDFYLFCSNIHHRSHARVVCAH